MSHHHEDPVTIEEIDRTPTVNAGIRYINECLSQPWSAGEISSGKVADMTNWVAGDRTTLEGLFEPEFMVTIEGTDMRFERP